MSKKESITTLSKVKKDFDFNGLLKNIALPLGGGIIVGLLTKGTMDTYDKVKKPIFAPPNIVFPIVWIILYILIGGILLIGTYGCANYEEDLLDEISPKQMLATVTTEIELADAVYHRDTVLDPAAE